MHDRLLKTVAEKTRTSASINNLIRRNPLYYSSALRLIERVSGYGLEERISWTKQRLRQVARNASLTPYGKKCGSGTNIDKWPLLSKSTVRENINDFLYTSRLLSSPANTSGSTGTPLRVFRSFRSVTVEQAMIDHLALKKGIDLAHCRIAVLRGDTIKAPTELTPPFWRLVNRDQKLLLSAHHLMPGTIDDYHEILERFAPHCLMAYPSALESLSGLLKQCGKRLNIPLVMTSSEQLSEATWETAKNCLCCEIIDHYGQGERVVLAYATCSGHYYFHCSYGYTELIYAFTDGDQDYYEIVGTSFWNKTMSLIRYRTGDLISVPHGTGEDELLRIRYGLSPFTGIEGRSGDYLLSPGGARLIGMNHIPRDVENIIQAQLIQESIDRVRIMVVPTRDFSDNDKAKLLDNARAKIPESMSIDIEIVERLERTKLGKAPFLIRQINHA
jgi:phenylacetate-CoA ligase